MVVCRGPHLGSGTRLRAGLRAGLRNGLRNGLLIGLRIVKQYLSAGSGSYNDWSTGLRRWLATTLDHKKTVSQCIEHIRIASSKPRAD